LNNELSKINFIYDYILFFKNLRDNGVKVIIIINFVGDVFEKIGIEKLEMDLSAEFTVGKVLMQLCELYPETNHFEADIFKSKYMVFVNKRIASLETELHDGQGLLIIPYMIGG